ncbi:3119_t:CDS:2 [Ambispora leptoticha]|uniref:Cytochrome b-c1 complex subunit 7 n=1 Tax=Ambispora leptoticha TaxID=144679 RepID=A0A9N8V9F3_9GLOM|nr:3119_t:CDS:2 [Ambispora leptoticha]
MSYPTLAPYIRKSPFLTRILKPIANVVANASGYRQLGLRYDDIIQEESETVQEALKRLPIHEDNYRTVRIRNAYQLSLQHHILPKEQWTKPEEDVRYLSPIIDEVVAEEAEREAFDAMKIIKK